MARLRWTFTVTSARLSWSAISLLRSPRGDQADDFAFAVGKGGHPGTGVGDLVVIPKSVACPLQRVFHRLDELRGIERLGKETVRTRTHGGDHGVNVPMGREKDRGKVPSAFQHLLVDLHSGYPVTQLVVQKQAGRSGRRAGGEQAIRLRVGTDFVSVRFKQDFQAATDRLVVVQH